MVSVMWGMKSEEIRNKFIKFFERQGHKVVPSSSLIPDDPSVLLTTAGMQQFKPYYTGKADAMRDFGSKNVCSVQKCFRTSDIDEVGDISHLTFFEMLGNFSFGRRPGEASGPEGGYFKKEAIKFAYDFVVNEMGVERDRITISVFGGTHSTGSTDSTSSLQAGSLQAGSEQEIPFDGESYNIWHKEIGIEEKNIFKGNKKDNFWGPTGNEGPCGPTTEIYADGVEIWNIVFNEYYQGADGALKKLETPGVDTGMGLERLAIMLQGVKSVFETDLFVSLVSQIKEVSHGLEDKVLRILADHLRSSIFLIADGVRPSNKEAGYILRRLIRRVMVYSIKYDIHADLFPLAIEIIKNEYGKWYPEVRKDKEILDVLTDEKTKFEKAVASGVKEIEKYEKITAHDAFYIYETFGLPFELLQELVPKKVEGVKKEHIEEEFKRHQEVSRAGVEKKFGGHGLVMNTGELKAASNEEMEQVVKYHTATHLLQQALRDVLGDSVEQRGSDITAERLRFDFVCQRKLTDEELKKVEEIVNEKINIDLPVSFEEMPFEKAKKSGARAFFKEKYPDRVRVYSIGPEHVEGQPYSKEICGGPHVTNTLKIGKFKISKQEAVSAGVRRIRAVIE